MATLSSALGCAGCAAKMDWIVGCAAQGAKPRWIGRPAATTTSGLRGCAGLKQNVQSASFSFTGDFVGGPPVDSSTRLEQRINHTIGSRFVHLRPPPDCSCAAPKLRADDENSATRARLQAA